MSNTNKVGNTLSRIITYILVVLLVLGVAGIAVSMVMRDQGITFYAEYDGKRYFANDTASYITLTPGETYDFTVAALDGGEMDYVVKVTSNADNNFDFTADGNIYKFYGDDDELNDYSDIFAVMKTQSGFTFTVPQNYSLQNMLESKYRGEVTLSGDMDITLSYFTLTVTSGDSVVTMKLLPLLKATNIWFSPSKIIF